MARAYSRADFIRILEFVKSERQRMKAAEAVGDEDTAIEAHLQLADAVPLLVACIEYLLLLLGADIRAPSPSIAALLWNSGVEVKPVT